MVKRPSPGGATATRARAAAVRYPAARCPSTRWRHPSTPASGRRVRAPPRGHPSTPAAIAPCSQPADPRAHVLRLIQNLTLCGGGRSPPTGPNPRHQPPHPVHPTSAQLCTPWPPASRSATLPEPAITQELPLRRTRAQGRLGEASAHTCTNRFLRRGSWRAASPGSRPSGGGLYLCLWTLGHRGPPFLTYKSTPTRACWTRSLLISPYCDGVPTNLYLALL